MLVTEKPKNHKFIYSFKLMKRPWFNKNNKINIKEAVFFFSYYSVRILVRLQAWCKKVNVFVHDFLSQIINKVHLTFG